MNVSLAIHHFLLAPAFVFLIGSYALSGGRHAVRQFMSTPRAGRVGVCRSENYQVMIEDPIFWRSLTNNLWFALATIPASIAISIAMALWVNERIAGQFLRMSIFCRRCCQ